MRRQRTPDPDAVSASEIARWAWCPEAWRLDEILGHEPANRADKEKRRGHHEGRASFEARSRSNISLGPWLLAAAGLLALLALFVLARG
jgi:hypothetical protein